MLDSADRKDNHLWYKGPSASICIPAALAYPNPTTEFSPGNPKLRRLGCKFCGRHCVPAIIHTTVMAMIPANTTVSKIILRIRPGFFLGISCLLLFATVGQSNGFYCLDPSAWLGRALGW